MKVFEYTIGNFTSTVVCADEQEFKRHMQEDCGEDIRTVAYTVIQEFGNTNTIAFDAETA
tara:strand:+ start:64 stop:243 length:180 start_codon:yes stop_codon:yes gene_type:complete